MLLKYFNSLCTIHDRLQVNRNTLRRSIQRQTKPLQDHALENCLLHRTVREDTYDNIYNRQHMCAPGFMII
jgi:hypothetical protein